MKHSIELLTGHTDKTGVEHRDVEFGRRLIVGDIIALDNDPQAQNPTQYNLLILRRMITKFGTLRLPVDLRVMLSLDSIDREDLSDGADAFLAKGREGLTHEYRDDGSVKLCFGFDIDGTPYQVVRFGSLTTGADEVEADNQKLSGVGREAFLLGRQITRLETDDGAAGIDGTVDLEMFKKLDGGDFNVLRIGAQKARESFRRERAAIRRQRNGDGGADHDEGNRDDRAADPGDADGQAQDLSAGDGGDAKKQ